MKKELDVVILIALLISILYRCKKEEVSSSSVPDFYLKIAAGGHHSLALSTDKSLWAWGYNGEHGSLGDGTNVVASTTPVSIGSDYSTISCTGYFSLGLKGDGTLWAWGDNRFGQLGDGTNVDKNTPVLIGSHSGQ